MVMGMVVEDKFELVVVGLGDNGCSTPYSRIP